MFVTMIIPGLICVQVLMPHHNRNEKFRKSVPEHLRTRNTAQMQKLGSIIHTLIGTHRLLFVAVIKKMVLF